MSSVLYDVPGPKARRISLIGSIVGSLLILGLLAWIIMTFAQQGIFEGRRWQIFTRADVWTLLGNGLGATLSAAAIAAVIAAPRGMAGRWLSVVVRRFYERPTPAGPPSARLSIRNGREKPPCPAGFPCCSAS